jgi:hypothetical protein
LSRSKKEAVRSKNRWELGALGAFIGLFGGLPGLIIGATVGTVLGHNIDPEGE